MNIFYPLVVFGLFLGTAYAEDNVNCDNAFSTYEIISCQGQELTSLRKELSRYLDAAKKRIRHDDFLSTKENALVILDESQEKWEEYARQHCDVVWNLAGGTSKNIVYLSCMQNETVRRTHQVWLSYLNYGGELPSVPNMDEPTRPELPIWLPVEPMKAE